MTGSDFDYLCSFLRERCAVVLEPGKEYLVEARLLPLVRKRNLDSISDIVACLRSRSDAELPAQVVAAMVTTETYFFRDPLTFESLRASVLPDLIARRRDERRLNIWCAACSTGQEPYSVAMLLREHFSELERWSVSIYATDISRDVLARARQARFTQLEANRGLPIKLLLKYFKQQGIEWMLSDDIRTMVEFREMNLAAPWPDLPRMDLILIRNVMIYFAAESKKSILSRVAELLRPDGYLLLGGAETTFNLVNCFQRVEKAKSGFYQRIEGAC
ncbi:MAG: protein-glutamate O-methyltransferase CheR [Gemmataceae bacterium]